MESRREQFPIGEVPVLEIRSKKAAELCINGKLKEASLHVSPSEMEWIDCKYIGSP
jgi:hypothetical protein